MSSEPRPELNISSGWMNAAGMLGFAPVPGSLLPEPPVAFVTNPISYKPRTPAADRFCSSFPGGFLLHTGWPNPGFRKALTRYSTRWARSEVQVWVHLLVEQPHEVNQMVRALEETDGVAAIEIGLPPIAKDDLRLQLVEAALGELPVTVCVPLDQVNAAWVEKVIDLGVSGLVISAPRGVVANTAGGFSRGRMYGSGLFPQVLLALGCLRTFGIPLIAGSGVYDQQAIDTLLSAGAAAVQLDAVLWRGWQVENLG